MIADKILGIPRSGKRFIVLLMDMILVPLALWMSFSLRLGVAYVPEGDIGYLIMAAPLIAVPIFIRLGLYRAIIRYIGFMAMWTVIKAVSLYTLVWGTVVLLTAIPGVPRSVLLINWLVTLLLIGGTRALARWWLTGSFKGSKKKPARKNVAIYGAGSAGVQTAISLANSIALKPVAFIDDSPMLQGNTIEGLRIYAFSQLDSLIERYEISEVLLAMPSISRSRRSAIISRLEPYLVHVTTLPNMEDLASGKIKANDIREVGAMDLLGRNPVEPDAELLNSNVRGKVVLVTGAGGSIGSELCRQIIRIEPEVLLLYERSEHDLYQLEIELVRRAKTLLPEWWGDGNRIVPILASVTNRNRMEKVCTAFGVQTIYHAAAYKHVPMVEKNPLEAIQNNILGTYESVIAAMNSKVETFVLISTDKAVRPTNTMGATKRFAEMILQALARHESSQTRFTMVRFGNVLGSSGSVIPLFREQIRNGGPVTVTDPKIIRYFMTIPEAAQLVIQAGSMGQGGEVFVLDMGEPVKILDMARRLIHLSGLEIKDESNPEGDIEIVYTGLRPGEKLYEELLIGDEVEPTKHPLIMSANDAHLEWKLVEQYVTRFRQAIDLGNAEQGRALLEESVADFKPQCDVADLVLRQDGFAKSKPGESSILH